MKKTAAVSACSGNEFFLNVESATTFFLGNVSDLQFALNGVAKVN